MSHSEKKCVTLTVKYGGGKVMNWGRGGLVVQVLVL